MEKTATQAALSPRFVAMFCIAMKSLVVVPHKVAASCIRVNSFPKYLLSPTDSPFKLFKENSWRLLSDLICTLEPTWTILRANIILFRSIKTKKVLTNWESGTEVGTRLFSLYLRFDSQNFIVVVSNIFADQQIKFHQSICLRKPKKNSISKNH